MQPDFSLNQYHLSCFISVHGYAETLGETLNGKRNNVLHFMKQRAVKYIDRANSSS